VCECYAAADDTRSINLFIYFLKKIFCNFFNIVFHAIDLQYFIETKLTLEVISYSN